MGAGLLAVASLSVRTAYLELADPPPAPPRLARAEPLPQSRAPALRVPSPAGMAAVAETTGNARSAAMPSPPAGDRAAVARYSAAEPAALIPATPNPAETAFKTTSAGAEAAEQVTDASSAAFAKKAKRHIVHRKPVRGNDTAQALNMPDARFYPPRATWGSAWGFWGGTDYASQRSNTASRPRASRWPF